MNTQTNVTEASLATYDIIKLESGLGLAVGSDRFDVVFIELEGKSPSITIWLATHLHAFFPEEGKEGWTSLLQWDEAYITFRYKWSIARYLASRLQTKGVPIENTMANSGGLMRFGFRARPSQLQDVDQLVNAVKQFAKLAGSTAFLESVQSTAKEFDRCITTSKVSVVITEQFAERAGET